MLKQIILLGITILTINILSAQKSKDVNQAPLKLSSIIEYSGNELYKLDDYGNIFLAEKVSTNLTLSKVNVKTGITSSEKLNIDSLSKKDVLLDFSFKDGKYVFLFPRFFVSYNSITKYQRKVRFNKLNINTKIKFFHKVKITTDGIYLYNFFSSNLVDKKIKLVRLDSNFNIVNQHYEKKNKCDPFSIYYKEFSLISNTPNENNFIYLADEMVPVFTVLDKELNQKAKLDLSEYIKLNPQYRDTVCSANSKYTRKGTSKSFNNFISAIDKSSYIEKVIPMGNNKIIFSIVNNSAEMNFYDVVFEFDDNWRVKQKDTLVSSQPFNPKLPISKSNFPRVTFFGAQTPVANNKYLVTNYISSEPIEECKKRVTNEKALREGDGQYKYLLVFEMVK